MTHKGDYWSNIIRSKTSLSDKTTVYIFEELEKYLDKYNKAHDTNFKFFETRRNKDRQRRLIGKGKSQVANIFRAPHVEGRAVDIAETVFDTGRNKNIWVWDNNRLKELHTWLKANFPLFKLLRTGGDFKHFSDLPHYEIKRRIWIEYNKS